eukprot:6157582-Pyramimonas_sp.AAC.1
MSAISAIATAATPTTSTSTPERRAHSPHRFETATRLEHKSLFESFSRPNAEHLRLQQTQGWSAGGVQKMVPAFVP